MTDGRCFICGATEHRSDVCTRPSAPAARPADATGQAATTPTNNVPPTTTSTPATASAKSAVVGESLETIAARAVRNELRAELTNLLTEAVDDAYVQRDPAGRAARVVETYKPDVKPMAKVVRMRMSELRAMRVKIVDGRRLVLGDTGATHELRAVRSFAELGPRAYNVSLETATKNEKAMMLDNVVYVEGDPEVLQPLFPLAEYVESMGLDMRWDQEQCSLTIPRTGKVLELQQDVLANVVGQSRISTLKACLSRAPPSTPTEKKTIHRPSQGCCMAGFAPSNDTWYLGTVFGMVLSPRVRLEPLGPLWNRQLRGWMWRVCLWLLCYVLMQSYWMFVCVCLLV